jgi:phospholipid-translocating ATPase
MFNITFTALPIFIYGLFDQNFNDRQLLDNLHLYRTISRNSRMSWLQFLKWNLLGAYQTDNFGLYVYFF